MSDKYQTFGEVSIVLDVHKEILSKHDEQIGNLLKVTENMLTVQGSYIKTTNRLGAILMIIIASLIAILIDSQTDFIRDYRELIDGRDGKANSGNYQTNPRDQQSPDNESNPVFALIQSEFIKPDVKVIDSDGVLHSTD